MCTLEDYLLNYVDSITYYSLMFQKFSEKFEKPYICTVNSMAMAGQALSSDMIYTLVMASNSSWPAVSQSMSRTSSPLALKYKNRT